MTNERKVAGADIFFLLLVVLQFPVFYAIGYISRVTDWEIPTVVSILFNQGYYLVGVILYLLVTKQNFLELARVRKFHLGSAFLVVLLLVVSAPVSTWLNLVSQLFVRNIAAEAVYDISVAVPLLTGILILGLLPGVVEEIIFRGVFLPIHSLRSIKAGIIISALMFSFMHMNFNQMAYTFFLGLLFAVTVVATNSILATVLMHAVFNAFNTALMYAVPALMEWAERLSEAAGEAAPSLEEVVTQGAEKIEILIMAAIFTPFAMGGLAMTAVLLYLIAKLNKREDILMSLVSKKHAEHDPVDKSVVLFNPFLLAGLGVCLAMALWSALGGNL